MYQITITETKPQMVIKHLYSSPEQLDKLGLKSETKDGWGYVDREIEELVDTQIYSQRVDELDLKKVIDAINQ